MDFIMFLGASLGFFLVIALASNSSNPGNNLAYLQAESRNDQSFIIRNRA